jgi:DNA polymerase-3 subunit alpha
MIARYPGSKFWKEFVENTLEIENKCKVELELGVAQLPHFEIPKDNEEFNSYKLKFTNLTEEQIYLRFLSEKGLQARGLWDSEGYQGRLYKELETIIFTGFTRYFLTTQEFVCWARIQNIKIGSGRGSCVGSLVTYCLGITNIDPIKYELSMDRFLYAEANYRAKVEDFFSHVEREKNIGEEKCNGTQLSALSE